MSLPAPRWTLSALAVAVPLLAHGHALADGAMEEEIVVTAARMASPLEVVTDPRLPRQPLPAHDGADYLKTVSGFSVIRKGGTDGDPLFRGMAGSRVAVLNEEAMLLGGCGNRMDPPTAYVFPQSYDRIRILKGPQSVLWAPGASSATVRFERDPFDPETDRSTLAAGLTVGSWGRRDAALDGLLGGRLGYLRVQGTDSESDDYDSGDGTPVHSAYDRWNVNLMAGWRPDEATLVELSLARSDGEAAYADRAMDGVVFDRESTSLRLRRSFTGPLLQALDVQLATGSVDHVMDNFSLRAFAPTAMMGAPSVSNPDRETKALRALADLALGEQVSARVGIDGHRDDHRVRSSMNALRVDFETRPRVGDARLAQAGVFGELTWQASEQQRWVLGARADRWQAEDLRATVGSMMMARPNPTAGAHDDEVLLSAFARLERTLAPGTGYGAGETQVFLGLGHSERIADYWERFGTGRVGESSASAFFTDPERTTQLDLGLRREGPRAALSVALFAAQHKDYILIDARPEDRALPAVVTRNVDAVSLGGEVDYTQRLGEAWQLTSTLAYSWGRNRTDGTALAQMPPLEGRVALSWRQGPVTLGGMVRLVADQDRVDLGAGNIVGQDFGRTDGFAIASLNGHWQLREGTAVSLGVDNLFDKAYAEHLSRSGADVTGFDPIAQLPEPGRTLWLKLDARL